MKSELIEKWENEQFEAAGVPKPITARELQELELPPLQWVAKDILPAGVAVLAAKPKRGKSYFALDLCLSVCSGSNFLGYKTTKGACLYFDIESGRRRPKSRIEQKLGERKAPDNLYIVTLHELAEAGRRKFIGEGFEQQLSDLLKAYTGIKLVVIDIFGKVRRKQKKGEDPYDKDYDDFNALAPLADKFDVCFLCIMHNTKSEHDDPFDDIQGSAGVMGAVDTALVIQTGKSAKGEADLYIRGRDIEEQKIIMSFDNGDWKKIGTAEDIERQQFEREYSRSNVIKTVFKLLEDHDSWSGTAKELITASIYAGTHIAIDDRSVGVELSKFKSLLLEEGIAYTKVRKSKGWEQCFKRI